MPHRHCFPNKVLHAAAELSLSQNQFSMVSPARWKTLLKDIMIRFTGSEDIQRLWIWNDLRGDVATLQSDYGPDRIAAIFEPTIYVWFITEDASRTKQDGNFWVFEGELGAILRVIGNFHYFEYAIVDRRLEWMICENHHDMLIAVGEPAITRLRTLAGEAT